MVRPRRITRPSRVRQQHWSQTGSSSHEHLHDRLRRYGRRTDSLLLPVRDMFPSSGGWLNMDGGEMERAEADAEVPSVAPQDSAEQEPTFQDLLEERLSTLGFAPYSPEEAEALRQMPEFSLIWPAGEQTGLRPLEALRVIDARWNKPDTSLRPNEG